MSTITNNAVVITVCSASTFHSAQAATVKRITIGGTGTPNSQRKYSCTTLTIISTISQFGEWMNYNTTLNIYLRKIEGDNIMNKDKLTKIAEDIVTTMYEKEFNDMKQYFSEDSIPKDLICDIIKDKLLKNKPKPKPKIYRKILPESSITIDGTTIYQLLQYNPRTDHITISSGFTK